MKARVGKIARLPKAVREQLNQRLADGEQVEPLIRWLHSLPEVLEVLVRDFAGRPILKQNLSEWRQGGFRDWEARQERLAGLHLLNDEADEVEAAAPHLPDLMASLLAGRFASIIAATMQVKDWNKPRHRAQLMEMNEAVATLRRFDQGAARLQLERDQHELKKAELQLAQEAQTKRTHEQWRELAKACHGRLIRECKTPEDLLAAISRLIFGEEPYDEGSQQKDAPSNRPAPSEEQKELAASIINQRDELERDKADIQFRTNKLKMRKVEAQDAAREVVHEVLSKAGVKVNWAWDLTKNQATTPKESQTQSGPVKPSCAASVPTDPVIPSSADEEREEPSQGVPIPHPPEGDKEAEKASSITEDEPKTLREDLAIDAPEPDDLRSENVLVMLEPSSQTKQRPLC